MRSGSGDVATRDLTAALDSLAAADPMELADQPLREQLRELVVVSHRLHAELVRRVDAFDTRRLAGPDGFRTTKGWLRAFTRLSGPAAHRLVAAARMLRRLPKLAAAAQAGDASAEHLQQVSRLVEQVGEVAVAEIDPVLAEASAGVDPQQLGTVCARVRAHLDPDGADPAAVLDRRGLTLSPVAGMMAIRGQLDPEGGAVLATAIDALMTPPGDGDERSPAQRRADALVELAGRPLAAGTLPLAGGQRPQVGFCYIRRRCHRQRWRRSPMPRARPAPQTGCVSSCHMPYRPTPRRIPALARPPVLALVLVLVLAVLVLVLVLALAALALAALALAALALALVPALALALAALALVPALAPAMALPLESAPAPVLE